MHKMIILVL